MTIIFALFLAAFSHPEMVVESDWLAGHLNDPGIRIVDMRRMGYPEGHIPGAVHLANEAIRDAKAPPNFVPTAEAFGRLMGSLGISNTTRVIVYDGQGGLYAARLWWILNYFGHSNVTLLNGGWTKWSKESRPSVSEVPTPAAAGFTARPDARWIATANDVAGAIGKKGAKIVDVRTPGEIEGKDLRNIKRGGHVPSSIPVYWEEALDSQARTLKPADEIAKVFASKGIFPSDAVIVYCQVGMRASHQVFVLHLLGYTNVKNYYGAWEEWGNRDDLPVEIGPVN